MDHNQFQFHLDEYRSLKSGIEYRVKATERIEYLVVVAIVATYAWFSQRTVPSVMWWIPVALPLLGSARQTALLIRIRQVAEYIRQIENIACTMSPTGWEHFLQEKRRRPKGYLISLLGYLFWALLLAATITIAQIGGLSLPSLNPK